MARKGAPKRVCLAYSGGLDTSVILRWLKEEYGSRGGRLLRRRGPGGGALGAPREGPRHRRRRLRDPGRARGVRARLRVPGDPRQRRLRGQLPARDLPGAPGDRQAPGGGGPGDGLRRRRPRRHRQGQRPGALRARLSRPRSGARRDRPLARVGLEVAHRLHGLRPEVRHPGQRHAEEAVLDGPQPDARELRGRDPRGPLARARRIHVHPDQVGRGRSRRARRSCGSASSAARRSPSTARS